MIQEIWSFLFPIILSSFIYFAGRMTCREGGGGRSGLSRDQKHRWRLFVCLSGSVFIIKASLPSHWWGSFLNLYWVHKYICIYMCAHACTICVHIHIYLTFVLLLWQNSFFLSWFGCLLLFSKFCISAPVLGVLLADVRLQISWLRLIHSSQSGERKSGSQKCFQWF